MDDFFEIEQQLLDRLAAVKAAVPDLRVYNDAELAYVKVENFPHAPALVLAYAGDDFGKHLDGAPVYVTADWAVTVATRNQRNRTAARRACGAILPPLLNALLGFKPSGQVPDYEPLAAIRCPPGDFRAGFYFKPIVFRTAFYLQGANP